MSENLKYNFSPSTGGVMFICIEDEAEESPLQIADEMSDRLIAVVRNQLEKSVGVQA